MRYLPLFAHPTSATPAPIEPSSSSLIVPVSHEDLHDAHPRALLLCIDRLGHAAGHVEGRVSPLVHTRHVRPMAAQRAHSRQLHSKRREDRGVSTGQA